jgi:hypothetical protein
MKRRQAHILSGSTPPSRQRRTAVPYTLTGPRKSPVSIRRVCTGGNTGSLRGPRKWPLRPCTIRMAPYPSRILTGPLKVRCSRKYEDSYGAASSSLRDCIVSYTGLVYIAVTCSLCVVVDCRPGERDHLDFRTSAGACGACSMLVLAANSMAD